MYGTAMGRNMACENRCIGWVYEARAWEEQEYGMCTQDGCVWNRVGGTVVQDKCKSCEK